MDIRKRESHLFEELDNTPHNGHIRGERAIRPGKVFFLARSGLRSLSRTGRSFLGYEASELFWRDVLDLVHPQDVPALEARISSIVRSPGTSSSIEVRLRDASGVWRRVEAGVQNVLESPGDTGLLVVDFRTISNSSAPAYS